jgi:hypothetical protein
MLEKTVEYNGSVLYESTEDEIKNSTRKENHFGDYFVIPTYPQNL